MVPEISDFSVPPLSRNLGVFISFLKYNLKKEKYLNCNICILVYEKEVAMVSSSTINNI